MRTATGNIVIDNGQLISGTGAAPVPAAALHIADGKITYAGPASAAPPRAADRAANRRPRRHHHAGPGRGAFPSDLLQRRRPRRPRHQVSGRVRHAAGRRQRPAGPGVRLHRGTLRRQPVQHRRLAQEGDRERHHPRSAPGGERPGDLRRRRADGLEPRLPQDRHGGPRAARQRRRRGAGRGAQAGQGRRRMGQDLPDRRRRRPGHQRPPHAVHDLRGDARLRRHGPQPRPEGHRPLPGDRGHQERPAGRLRHAGARHLHGRRGPRHAAGARTRRWCRPCNSSTPASWKARASACRSASSTATRRRWKAAPRAPAGS